MALDDAETARLAEIHWRRWYAAIQADDPRAIEALHDLMRNMARNHPSSGLTPAQVRVLAAYSRYGTRYKVADALGIGPETVKTQLSEAKQRLGARTTAHAVAMAIRQRLIW